MVKNVVQPPGAAPRERRRVRHQPEEQRERILSAAITVFATIGYAHATMGHIAAEAKISRTLLYHYFSGKELIFDAAMVAALDRIDPVFQGLSTMEGTLEEQIRAIFDRFHEVMEEQPDIPRLCVEIASRPDVPHSPAYEKRIALIRVSLMDWLERIGPRMRPGVDAEQFLYLVFSALVFWFLPTPFGRALGAGPAAGSAAAERHKRAACDLLVNGLTVGRGPNSA
jgi:AcrR family transcriptional regulator